VFALVFFWFAFMRLLFSVFDVCVFLFGFGFCRVRLLCWVFLLVCLCLFVFDIFRAFACFSASGIVVILCLFLVDCACDYLLCDSCLHWHLFCLLGDVCFACIISFFGGLFCVVWTSVVMVFLTF